MLVLEQCRGAVDKGLHAGGAFSAVIPLVSLYCEQRARRL
jgi:transketolase